MTSTTSHQPVSRSSRAAVSTRARLAALAVSSPLWAVVSLAQAVTREGFDLTRHPLSMLATGSLAWLQIANFVIAGGLAVASAAGMKKVLPSSRWVPRLLVTYGVGYILSGIFTLDAGGGFPAGTPTDTAAVLSWHAIVHLIVGMVAFIALAAVLIIVGRQFARRSLRAWAALSFAGAAMVIIGNLIASAQVGSPSLALAVGVLFGMLTLSAIAAKLRRQV
ncbi:DUF998 domain-containing protein [Nonomuraea sp. NPDC050663]|uniref:DUF998 domain-containing protein n=1 Tax=Nonomuraea sp. NPDC050663 TaxID=3364370 RepID=UPI0037B2DD08